MITIPKIFQHCTGAVHSVEKPEQGGNFEVFFITSGFGKFVLKRSSSPELIAALISESEVLTQLSSWQPVVAQPLAHVFEQDCSSFLFTHLEGNSLSAAVHKVPSEQQHEMIASAARILRGIHAWKPNLIQNANWINETVASSLVTLSGELDRDSFLQYTSVVGLTQAEIETKLESWSLALEPDIVFGHGDYCLPNVLMQGLQATGIIDWGDGGYIDRRFDLATAALSIRHNLKHESFVDTFLMAYDYNEPKETLHLFEALYCLM